jgi:hypothetical protein
MQVELDRACNSCVGVVELNEQTEVIHGDTWPLWRGQAGQHSLHTVSDVGKRWTFRIVSSPAFAHDVSETNRAAFGNVKTATVGKVLGDVVGGNVLEWNLCVASYFEAVHTEAPDVGLFAKHFGQHRL